jgi:hypothetical protein
MSWLGTLLWLGYRLNRHRVGCVPLSMLAGVGAILSGFAAWRGSLSALQAVGASLLCVALVGIGLWARGQGYLRFLPEAMPSLCGVSPPLPDERVPVRASGRFEVMHKRCRFVGTQAAFSTLDSGDHVIMAHIPRSRFLLLGQWPSGEVGWWYIFLTPRELESITPGELVFGPRARPALKVCYRPDRRAEQIVYLGFADPMQRNRVRVGLSKR